MADPTKAEAADAKAKADKQAADRKEKDTADQKAAAEQKIASDNQQQRGSTANAGPDGSEQGKLSDASAAGTAPDADKLAGKGKAGSVARGKADMKDNSEPMDTSQPSVVGVSAAEGDLRVAHQPAVGREEGGGHIEGPGGVFAPVTALKQEENDAVAAAVNAQLDSSRDDNHVTEGDGELPEGGWQRSLTDPDVAVNVRDDRKLRRKVSYDKKGKATSHSWEEQPTAMMDTKDKDGADVTVPDERPARR